MVMTKFKLFLTFLGTGLLMFFWFFTGQLKVKNALLNKQREDLEADKKINEEYEEINKNIASAGFFKLDDELFANKNKNS